MRFDPDNATDLIEMGVRDAGIDNLETDEDGQLVVYTGIYRWKDGSYHDRPEESGQD